MPVSNTSAGVAFQNAVLDGILGPTRGSTAPAGFVVRAWFDNPESDDPTEADFTGYTPPTWDSDDWLAAEGGVKLSDGLAALGTPSADASDALRFWSLHDTTSEELVYSAPLRERMWVTAGSNPVRIRLAVPYGFNN